jgi:CRP-like cAMP-binding protein
MLIRRMESIGRLNDEETRVLANLPVQVVDLGADEDIVRENDRPSKSFVLLEGFCFSYKLTGEGRRQLSASSCLATFPTSRACTFRSWTAGSAC